MARPKEFELPPDIPSWLMTFSDVITLLMTFFILLLTFATNQPESFERMQVSMFSGGGASGFIGPPQSPMELDSILTRVRARSGRITTRGSEMPPINKDPAVESLSKGLKGLEESERRKLSTQHSATIPISLLVNRENKVSSQGQQQLKMLARHVRGRPFDVQILARDAAEQEAATALAWALYTNHGVKIHKIAIGHSDAWESDTPAVTFVLNNPMKGVNNGKEG